MIPAKNQRLLDYGLLGLPVASLPKSLSGCSSGFALGKTSWNEKLY
jgi:hypothetical protein